MYPDIRQTFFVALSRFFSFTQLLFNETNRLVYNALKNHPKVIVSTQCHTTLSQNARLCNSIYIMWLPGKIHHFRKNKKKPSGGRR